MEDGNSTRATDHKGPPYVPGKEHGYDLPPEIFKAELDAIGRRRGRPNTEQIPEPSVDRGLVGLALSGGGIRSATFALGVMQRLAKNKLFEKFDYLSTVSGGGYIGSSITWPTSAGAYPGDPYRHNDFRTRYSDHHPVVFNIRTGGPDDD